MSIASFEHGTRTTSLKPAVFAKIDAWLDGFRRDRAEARRRREIYARVCRELSLLSDSDLADLKLFRSDIPRIAREEAYGGVKA
ncbi:DUF1127 domain-containing protein [Amaricoccus macauensis]|uniref:DUF1127 domain-containing protein n=1 Tax=Amaricoccus macauensis TaxID=57001 RepID=UPI003C7BD248